MSFVRKDWVEQQIEKLGDLLRAILRLRQEKKDQVALARLRGATTELLGIEHATLTFGDPRSTAELLAEPHRIATLARLMAEEAQLHQEAGRTRDAESRAGWALELGDLALERATDPEGVAVLVGEAQELALKIAGGVGLPPEA